MGPERRSGQRRSDAKAAAALAGAAAARDAVADRLADLVGERRAVPPRRREGDQREGDGPRLALLMADAEDLQAILAEREAAVAGARGPAAADAVAAAWHVLRRGEKQAAGQALTARCEQLGALLLEGVLQLNATRTALGGGPSEWTPSVALMDALTRLDLRRDRGW